MPARHSKRRTVLRNKPKKDRPRYLIYILVLVVIIASYVFLNLSTKFWDKSAKLTLVTKDANGDVVLVIFDVPDRSITNYVIPKDVQVEVARQLGVWRLGSVWQLGKDEKLNGELLVETVTHYFNFPVYVWGDTTSLGFTKGIAEILKAMFSPYQTNLGFGDRVRLGIFAMEVTNQDRDEVDLSNSSSMKKMTLSDGEGGYVLVNDFGQTIMSNFADPYISSKEFKIYVKDGTATGGVAESVGKVIEVMGAKVAALEKGDVNGVCTVSGQDTTAVKRIAEVFSCKENIGKLDNSFDVEVDLGRDFSNKF